MPKIITSRGHSLPLLTWSMLSILVVHFLCHCMLGPLPHSGLLREETLVDTASGRRCSHMVSPQETGGSIPGDHQGPVRSDSCDELAGAHKATVPAPMQIDSTSRFVVSSLFRPDSRKSQATLLVRVHSVFPSQSCSLYLQHAALLI